MRAHVIREARGCSARARTAVGVFRRCQRTVAQHSRHRDPRFNYSYACQYRSVSNTPFRARAPHFRHGVDARPMCCHPGFTASREFHQKQEGKLLDGRPVPQTPIPPPSKNENSHFRSPEAAAHLVSRWGWALKLTGYFNERNTRARDSGILFQNVLEQAARKEYLENLQIKPTFLNLHALLTVHVWVIHRRLQLEGEKGEPLQEVLFDRLWEETTFRIRSEGVAEMTVNKHLTRVQKTAFMACLEYDKAIEQGKGKREGRQEDGAGSGAGAGDLGIGLMDDEEGLAPAGPPARGSAGEEDHLAAALYRNVFQSDEEVPVYNARALADYLRRQMRKLQKLSVEDIMKGRVTWDSPPRGVRCVELPGYHGSGMIHHDHWREALDVRGRTYFWNPVTHESRWELPPRDGEGSQTEADRPESTTDRVNSSNEVAEDGLESGEGAADKTLETQQENGLGRVSFTADEGDKVIIEDVTGTRQSGASSSQLKTKRKKDKKKKSWLRP